jgi:hypothetical protein
MGVYALVPLDPHLQVVGSNSEACPAINHANDDRLPGLSNQWAAGGYQKN